MKYILRGWRKKDEGELKKGEPKKPWNRLKGAPSEEEKPKYDFIEIALRPLNLKMRNVTILIVEIPGIAPFSMSADEIHLLSASLKAVENI